MEAAWNEWDHVLTVLYFTVKWAVKTGVKEAFQEMKEKDETK